MKITTFTKCYHPLCYDTNFLCLGIGSCNLTMLKKRGYHIPEHRYTMACLPAQSSASFIVTHIYNSFLN